MSQIVVPPAEIRKKLRGAEQNTTNDGNGLAIHTQLTLGEWLDREHAKEPNQSQSLDGLYVQAIAFLERHLRERLQIVNSEEVIIGFDPSRTRPRESQSESSDWARNEAANGLPNSIALRDLYPEFKGAGSMKSILLFEDPVRRVDDGWSSVATISVQYMHDRWCVTSVLVWGGPGTAQSRAADLFLPQSRVDGVDLREYPAYKNALDTDYPAPIRNKSK